jgi:hypothetical protein
MLENMVDHLRTMSPHLPPLDRMWLRFKRGLILRSGENAGAMNQMRSRVPKVAESVRGFSVPLVRSKTKIIRDARNRDWPADSWDSGIPVLHPEEPGGDRVIRSDADPEEWA